MITKTQAMTCSMFYHVSERNADGTAVRCRANGACKTWKTRPDEFRLPVKHGLRACFYLTPRNAREWLTRDPTEKRVNITIPADCRDMPLPIMADWLADRGMFNEEKYVRRIIKNGVPLP